MNLRGPLPLLLSSLALSACGDSLVGGPMLEELLGIEEVPQEVAWELRWYRGPGQPLLLECDLRPPWTGIHQLEQVVFGEVEVPPPEVLEVPEPGMIMEGEGFSWALALLVLVDAHVYWEADPEGQRSDLQEERGIWGVVPEYVLVFAEGDMDAARHELLVEPQEDVGQIAEGMQFMSFLPEVLLGTESLSGSLIPVEHEEAEHLWEPGPLVLHLEYLEEHIHEVFEGEPLGGAERQPCDDGGR